MANQLICLLVQVIAFVVATLSSLLSLLNFPFVVQVIIVSLFVVNKYISASILLNKPVEVECSCIPMTSLVHSMQSHSLLPVVIARKTISSKLFANLKNKNYHLQSGSFQFTFLQQLYRLLSSRQSIHPTLRIHRTMNGSYLG